MKIALLAATANAAIAALAVKTTLETPDALMATTESAAIAELGVLMLPWATVDRAELLARTVLLAMR